MKDRISLVNIVLIGVAAALLFSVQVAISFLPNIELVTLLIILYTLHFKSKALYIIYIFVILECIIYPFGLWCIVYFYIWAILYIAAYLCRRFTSPLFWAVFGAFYGLIFGTLSSFPYFFVNGIGGGLTYIVAGIKFDLLHCFGNFILILTLFKPLNNIIMKLTHVNIENGSTREDIYS